MVDKGEGRGRGQWTAKGVQATQEERLAALEAEVEALSEAVFGVEEPAVEVTDQ